MRNIFVEIESREQLIEVERILVSLGCKKTLHTKAPPIGVMCFHDKEYMVVKNMEKYRHIDYLSYNQFCREFGGKLEML